MPKLSVHDVAQSRDKPITRIPEVAGSNPAAHTDAMRVLRQGGILVGGYEHVVLEDAIVNVEARRWVNVE